MNLPPILARCSCASVKRRSHVIPPIKSALRRSAATPYHPSSCPIPAVLLACLLSSRNTNHLSIFVTICCSNRKRLLADDSIHAAFREFAERGQSEHQIAVGRYVLMPDHLHLFVCGPAEFKLDQWTRMLKTTLGKKFKELGCEPEFWQRGFFDHLIRNLESYSEKWNYVHQNPVRAGLVAQAEDWPYQGEIVIINRV